MGQNKSTLCLIGRKDATLVALEEERALGFPFFDTAAAASSRIRSFARLRPGSLKRHRLLLVCL